ncbi:MAG: nuclear transport factor 2 family protein, partial [Flavisolibacter sp.]|nr:nuclear transport factor 2 family protein [Flavisolibacter sp.]
VNFIMKEDEIKDAFAIYKKAVISGDLETLEHLHSENFVWNTHFDLQINKSENIQRISSGNLSYLSWTNEDIRVLSTGETAVLKSRQILKIIVYGLSINTEQDITAFFVKHNGRWLLSGGKEINLK